MIEDISISIIVQYPVVLVAVVPVPRGYRDTVDVRHRCGTARNCQASSPTAEELTCARRMQQRCYGDERRVDNAFMVNELRTNKSSQTK